jgi:hypothetical protein
MALTDALLLDPYPFETWIAVRPEKGSGTLNDPFGATTQAVFDGIMSTVMAGLTGPMLIHIGPGTFLTAGYSDEAGAAWQMKTAVKIVGAGMNATTLQLVNANANSPNYSQYFAIGHALTTGSPAAPNPLDFCEVSDLTIDCNLTAQSGNAVACGAIRLMGNHVKVYRVRAINWGTKTSQKSCFVIAVLTGDRSAGLTEQANVGISDCVAEFPDGNGTAAPITVLHVGGKEAGASDAEAFGKAPYIRNCFVDCGSLASPLTADIRALSMGWCRAGIVEGNHVHNVQFGGPYQEITSTREIVVRNNSYKNVVRGPYLKLGRVNGSVGSGTVSGSGSVATVTLTSPATHAFGVGDHIKLTPPPLAGEILVEITEVPSQSSFRYKSALSGSPVSLTSVQKVLGAGNVLVEGNVIELATGGTVEIPAIHVDDGKSDTTPDSSVDTPAYVHTEAIVRSNKIRYLNGDFETSFKGVGVRVSGSRNAIIRDNVVESGPMNPIKDFRCGTVKYSNNKTPAGALIQGYNGVTNQKYSELETEAEDALVLTLL